MSSVLDDNLVEGTPEENFAFDLLTFSQTYDPELFGAIRNHITTNFEKRVGKLSWKKHHYIAITKKNMQVDPGIIVASELIDDNEWAYSRCHVWRAIGNKGKKERRGRWFKCVRSQSNPVLTTGYQCYQYDIYILPGATINTLYALLPKVEENNQETH